DARPQSTRRWLKLGIAIALVVTLILHVPQLLWQTHLPAPRKLDELAGWRVWGAELDRIAAGAPVLCNRHQDAAEAAFYMPGQPDVWASSEGSRMTAYDFMPSPPPYKSAPRILFMGYHVSEVAAALHMTASTPMTFSIQ